MALLLGDGIMEWCCMSICPSHSTLIQKNGIVAIRQGFHALDLANFPDMIDTADDHLFKQIRSNPNHVRTS